MYKNKLIENLGLKLLNINLRVFLYFIKSL